MAFRLAAKLVTSLTPRRLIATTIRPFSGKPSSRGSSATIAAGAVTAAGATLFGALVYLDSKKKSVTAAAAIASAASTAAGEPSERGLNWRERRFLAHASLQYDGIAYLTPLDFLESVALSNGFDDGEGISTGLEPPIHKNKQGKKRHKRRRVLAEADYRAMLRGTPGKRRASDRLFRDMGVNGLISYPEFLFLLNVLSKSNYGFEVAFRAFDRNSDSRLDVDEFRLLYRVVANTAAPDSCSSELLAYGSGQNAPATSLLVHFFGSDCRDTLSAAEFSKFADNLQREVLLVEFKSGCGQTSNSMAPFDFGQAVLRRTRLNASDRRLRLGLLEDRVWHSEGVTADEYLQFFQFLLHIDDLFFALRMFEIAGKSIDQEDFQRAVKAVTGQGVSPKLLTIVFALFDVNGDGALSYGEFLTLFGDQDSVLKYNNSLAGSVDSHFDQYRKCVKKYMVLQQ